nr:hypothetical protein [uncultured Campylobacter sp.]
MGSNGYFDALAVSTSAFCVLARLRLWERSCLRLACWIGASLFLLWLVFAPFVSADSFSGRTNKKGAFNC